MIEFATAVDLWFAKPCNAALFGCLVVVVWYLLGKESQRPQ